MTSRRPRPHPIATGRVLRHNRAARINLDGSSRFWLGNESRRLCQRASVSHLPSSNGCALIDSPCVLRDVCFWPELQLYCRKRPLSRRLSWRLQGGLAVTSFTSCLMRRFSFYPMLPDGRYGLQKMARPSDCSTNRTNGATWSSPTRSMDGGSDIYSGSSCSRKVRTELPNCRDRRPPRWRASLPQRVSRLAQHHLLSTTAILDRRPPNPYEKYLRSLFQRPFPRHPHWSPMSMLVYLAPQLRREWRAAPAVRGFPSETRSTRFSEARK